MRRVEKEKEMLLDGENIKAVSSSSEELQRLRKLEERLEEAESEIEKMKKIFEKGEGIKKNEEEEM